MSTSGRFSLERFRGMETYRKLQAGQTLGQIVSYVTAPGGLILIKKFWPKPLEWISGKLKKYIIIPYHGLVEPLVGAILIDEEDKKTWKELKNKKITERADFIAKDMSKYVVSAIISLSTSLGVKKAVDVALDGPSGWGLILKSTVVDTAARLGAIAVNSTVLSTPANKSKRAMSETLQRMGIEKENADDIAVTTLFVGVPDTVGLIVGNHYLRRSQDGKGTSMAR